MSTSYDQKMKDGVCENISHDVTSAIDAVSNDINYMNISKNNVTSTGGAGSISVCANCGKEGSDVNNTCNKCKMVKYCNAACKKKHRHKHKKECEEHYRLAAEKQKEELRLAAEHAAKLHDEKLFKQPPPNEDCPICFLPQPSLNTGSKYHSCCGKRICSGCIYAVSNIDDEEKCPFCRTPRPNSHEEIVKRQKKRIESHKDDANAICNYGCCYEFGKGGLPQDYNKALDIWQWAAKLGSATAYCNIGLAYDYGKGVEIDKKKAVYYYELAAMGGVVEARTNLGDIEMDSGNTKRAVKHYMIAAGSGESKSLELIRRLYSIGDATKDDYMRALRAHQTYVSEIKSTQRDEAAAAKEYYRYY